MMEHTTDRLFWTLSTIIIAALLLTIGAKTFPNATQNVLRPLSGMMRQADKAQATVDNAISTPNMPTSGYNPGTDGTIAPTNNTTATDNSVNTATNSTLQKVIDSLNIQNRNYSDTITSLQAQLTNANTKNDALNTSLNNAVSEAQKQHSTDQATIDDIKAKNEQLYKQVNSGNGDAQQQLNDYQNQIASYKTQITQLNNQITTLQNASNSKDTTITNLTNQNNNLSNTVSDVQNTNTTNQSKINALNSQIDTLNKSVSDAQAKIGQLNNQIASNNTDAQNKYNDYQRQLGLSQDTINSLNRQLQDSSNSASLVSGLQDRVNQLFDSAQYLIQTPDQLDLNITNNNDGSATINGFSTNSQSHTQNLNIPSYIRVGNTALRVKYIADNAFSSANLNSVILPWSLEKIGNYSFAGNNLVSVTFTGNDNLKYLGDYAFSGNQLTAITMPNTITSTGTGTFQQNQLSQIHISDNLTTLEPNIFNQNNLKSLDLGRNVNRISFGALTGNPNLKTVGLWNDNLSIANNSISNFQQINKYRNDIYEKFTNYDGSQLSINDSVIPSVASSNYIRNNDESDSVTLCTGYIEPPSVTGTINVPAFISDNTTHKIYKVTQLGNPTSTTTMTGVGNTISNLNIPDTVISINQYAYYNQWLRNVSIQGNNLRYIGAYAFMSNYIQNIKIPNNKNNLYVPSTTAWQAQS